MMGAVLKICGVFFVLVVFAATAPVSGQETDDSEQARKELISRQKARQEVNRQLFRQQVQQRQMQIDQRSLLNQQRGLSQQQLRSQQIRSQNRQNSVRTPITEEDSRRNELVGQQRNQVGESDRRGQQSEVKRAIQTRQQEQDIRKETSALKQYYESLNRQLQREQQDLIDE